MEKTNIEHRIKAIIVEKLLCKSEEVKLDSSFTNDLGADSLDNIELIMEFEKEFNINIPDDNEEEIETVQDVIDYINKHRWKFYVKKLKRRYDYAFFNWDTILLLFQHICFSIFYNFVEIDDIMEGK